MREDQDRPDQADWWSENQPAPPAPTAATSQDPNAWVPDGKGSWMPPQSTWPAGKHWDATMANFVDDAAAPKQQNPEPGPGPTQAPANYGVPTSGFGSAPAPYVSDPNAPQYSPMPAYTPPTWTGGDYENPTLEDLQAMPGYQAQLAAGLQARNRSAAANGTVLNGGTVKGLERYAVDQTNNSYQDLRNNTFEAYKQRYQQFTDAAGMDLAARTLNANENQNAFQNRMNTYQGGNARTLSDYLTNLTARRNSELDYWGRLQDLNQTGSGLAGNSR